MLDHKDKGPNANPSMRAASSSSSISGRRRPGEPPGSFKRPRWEVFALQSLSDEDQRKARRRSSGLDSPQDDSQRRQVGQVLQTRKKLIRRLAKNQNPTIPRSLRIHHSLLLLLALGIVLACSTTVEALEIRNPFWESIKAAQRSLLSAQQAQQQQQQAQQNQPPNLPNQQHSNRRQPGNSNNPPEPSYPWTQSASSSLSSTTWKQLWDRAMRMYGKASSAQQQTTPTPQQAIVLEELTKLIVALGKCRPADEMTPSLTETQVTLFQGALDAINGQLFVKQQSQQQQNAEVDISTSSDSIPVESATDGIDVSESASTNDSEEEELLAILYQAAQTIEEAIDNPNVSYEQVDELVQAYKQVKANYDQTKLLKNAQQMQQQKKQQDLIKKQQLANQFHQMQQESDKELTLKLEQQRLLLLAEKQQQQQTSMQALQDKVEDNADSLSTSPTTTRNAPEKPAATLRTPNDPKKGKTVIASATGVPLLAKMRKPSPPPLFVDDGVETLRPKTPVFQDNPQDATKNINNTPTTNNVPSEVDGTSVFQQELQSKMSIVEQMEMALLEDAAEGDPVDRFMQQFQGQFPETSTDTSTASNTLASPENAAVFSEETTLAPDLPQQEDQQSEVSFTMKQAANDIDSVPPPATSSEPLASLEVLPDKQKTGGVPAPTNASNESAQPKSQMSFLRSLRRENENKRVPKELLNDMSSDMNLYEKESQLSSTEQRILKYVVDNAPTAEEIAEAGRKTAEVVGGFAVEAKPYVEAGLGLAWKAIGESYKLASKAVTKAQEEYQESARKSGSRKATPVGLPSSKRLIKKLPVAQKPLDVQGPVDAEFQKSSLEPIDSTSDIQVEAPLAESAQPVVTDEGEENLDADAIATKYIQTIQDRFSGKPEVYNEFVSILRMYQQQELAVPEVVRKISSLFAKQPDLIRKFGFFLPEATELLHVFAEEAETNLVTTEEGTINGIPLSSLGNDWSDPPTGEREDPSVSLESTSAWSPLRPNSPTLQMGTTNKSSQSQPAWSPRGQEPSHQAGVQESTPSSSQPPSRSIDQLAHQWASQAGRTQVDQPSYTQATLGSSSADQLAREWSERNHDEESASQTAESSLPNSSTPSARPSMEQLASEWSSINSDKDQL